MMRKIKVNFSESYGLDDYHLPNDSVRLRIWNQFIRDNIWTGEHEYPQFYNDIDELMMDLLKEYLTQYIDKHFPNIDIDSFFRRGMKVVDKDDELVKDYKLVKVVDDE